MGINSNFSLPNEITSQIFSYFKDDDASLVACSEVCNDWNKIAHSVLWKGNEVKITSKKKLVEYVRRFSEEISYNQFGTLKGSYSSHPEQKLSIFLGYGDAPVNEESKPDIEKEFLLTDEYFQSLDRNKHPLHCRSEESTTLFLAGKIVALILKKQPYHFLSVKCTSGDELYFQMSDKDLSEKIENILIKRIETIKGTVDTRNNIVAGIIAANIAVIGIAAISAIGI